MRDPSKNPRPGKIRDEGAKRHTKNTTPAGTGKPGIDIFSEADDRPERSQEWQDELQRPVDLEANRDHIREIYRIPDAWRDFGLEGEPGKSCRSPWRDDRTPSFSIFDDGRKFKDHATGESGDVFEFVKLSLDANFKESAQWIEEKLSIMTNHHTKRPTMPHKPAPKPEGIKWPSELVMGSQATWEGFARIRGLTFPAIHAAVHAGILRFTKVDGNKSFVVTDNSLKTGEIRRIDGKDFPNGRKVFGLSGVDKSWLVGADWLPETRETTPVFITEGSTDFLAAFNAYSRYRRAGAERSWLPVALLGASGKTLHRDLHEHMAGRLVRLAPDGDEAGDRMAEHWGAMLSAMGCPVEVLEMPRGRDIRDLLEVGELKPEEVFA